jgi:putative transposase
MREYRRGAHSVFSIHVHLVWVTKYRRRILSGDVALRVRDVLREVCARDGVLIIKGHVSRDHVHMFVSIPPQVAVSRLMQRLKGKSAHVLLREFSHLRRQFWGGHMWARGYFCYSSGQLTDEQVAEYIENQAPDTDEDFRVEGQGGGASAGATSKLQPASADPNRALPGKQDFSPQSKPPPSGGGNAAPP